MADVFWLGNFSLRDDFSKGLRSLGLKSEWVQEAHILGDAPELPIQPVYRWPGAASSAHRLLHFACQALQSGDLDILLLASADQAFVLSSPKAAGRWNLMPRASLSDHFNYSPEATPDQFLPALALQLIVKEIDPDQAGLAAVLDRDEFALSPAFPRLEWLTQGEHNFLAGLIHLCTALEERSAGLGLLFTPGLATVIERI
ncbi:hypothetical protein LARV_03188 [Longilinea arvoryzae]|uniref:Uncharacterized protein n=1 Tax=Longilinea arvoryzae TaxID=360412 RepID=A0A0S7BNS6_9CHLR|nr:hypothetical protein [Longilinea arvoryzae]GAP15402.1 hypothetical protein LARV_03188 [Longilinea arvoryzae]